MMKGKTSISDIIQKLSFGFHRYGVFVFFVVVVALLIVGIVILNGVITRTDDADGYTSEVNSITFDQATIDKVRQLNDCANDNMSIENGRLLPF